MRLRCQLDAAAIWIPDHSEVCCSGIRNGHPCVEKKPLGAVQRGMRWASHCGRGLLLVNVFAGRTTKYVPWIPGRGVHTWVQVTKRDGEVVFLCSYCAPETRIYTCPKGLTGCQRLVLVDPYGDVFPCKACREVVQNADVGSAEQAPVGNGDATYTSTWFHCAACEECANEHLALEWNARREEHTPGEACDFWWDCIACQYQKSPWPSGASATEKYSNEPCRKLARTPSQPCVTADKQ